MAGEADFAILSAIQAAPLDGPATWARRTGVDQSTLRRRVKALEDAGVLRGFVATPTAAAFGRTQVPHQFATHDAPDMNAIMAVEDVAWAASTLDGRTFVNTYEDGASRRPELEAILGPNVSTFEATTEPPPAVLGRIDIKVIRALLMEPRASIARLTELTGLSTKTVRNHRADLIAKHLVRVDPLLRPPTKPGRLFYHMSFHADPPARLETVAKAVPDAIIISLFREPPAAYLFCTAPGIQEQAEHQKAVENMPGVSGVTLLINRDFAIATGRLLRWCDDAIAAWSA